MNRSATALLLLAVSLMIPAAAAIAVPRADHVIVIIMENHDYDAVRVQPYTASLIANGSSFADSYAVTHPSQPNYIALWSGGLQGVYSDLCPAPGSPLSAENLGHACEA